jgi:hypothetical protein
LLICAAAAAAQMNNPWHLWQLWRSDVRLQRSCLAKHNAIMDQKMDRLMAQPPPDYTIAGEPFATSVLMLVNSLLLCGLKSSTIAGKNSHLCLC